jgi:hypothetical protein
MTGTFPARSQYGSGIIPKKFKEIRQAFKDVIMNSFFDVEYLQQYVNERSTYGCPDSHPTCFQRRNWKLSSKSLKLMD